MSNFKAFTHLSGLIFGFLGPLVILLTAEEGEVKIHARHALNWQLSLLLYIFLSFILMFVVIGIFTLFLFIALDFIFGLMAAAKAKDGVEWKYPLSIPFLKV